MTWQGWEETRGPFSSQGLTLIHTWISNHTHDKVWVEITYPFPNFNGVTVEVWKWISKFIPHFTRHAVTYPCLDKRWSMLIKGPYRTVAPAMAASWHAQFTSIYHWIYIYRELKSFWLTQVYSPIYAALCLNHLNLFPLQVAVWGQSDQRWYPTIQVKSPQGFLSCNTRRICSTFWGNYSNQ